jgi:hypothetical protein
MLPKILAVLSAASVMGLVSSAISTSVAGSQTEDQFKRYKAVEAYEVRPGVLMMPSYDSAGQVCEIGLEKLHYSPEVIRHGSDLSRKEIDELTAELAPADERGAESDILAGSEITLADGGTMTTISDYENVTIEIHAWQLKSSNKESTVEQDAVVIRWKHREC